MILEYEIMKFDGDLGRPNLFVPLCKDLRQDKSSALKLFHSPVNLVIQATRSHTDGVLPSLLFARGPGEASWPVCPPQPWEVAFRKSRASRPYRRLFSASDTTTGLRNSHGNSPVLSEGVHAA